MEKKPKYFPVNVSLLKTLNYSFQISVRGYCICLATGSYVDIITVQAPQPPTPQPYFVPERRTAKETVKEKKLQHSKVIFTLHS